MNYQPNRSLGHRKVLNVIVVSTSQLNMKRNGVMNSLIPDEEVFKVNIYRFSPNFFSDGGTSVECARLVTEFQYN